jgi:hypothetical protein
MEGIKMNNLIRLIVVFASISTCIAQQTEFPEYSGPYLGQKPPGKTAELFAPGLISGKKYVGCSGFLNDGTVFIYSTMKPGTDWRFKSTYVMELKDGRWTEPAVASFSSYLPYNFTVGPAGQTVYFTSLKSPDKTTSMLLEQANIWVVKLQSNGWTEPVMLGASINTEKHYENYPAVSSNGTVYYMSRREDGVGKTDVYRSRNIDGRYAEAENLGDVINTEESDQDPFIAPDESYLIVCQRKPEGYGEYDLYISFRKNDDSWTEPVNMGARINSSEFEFRPYVTPDGKYLFFTSNRPGPESELGGIYWVDAGIIEELKPDDL